MQAALAALGLRAGGFDSEGLKAAFRREALRVHPDRGGSDESFRELKHAYNRLKKFLKESAAPPPQHHESRRSATAGLMGAGSKKMDPAAFNAAFEREHLSKPIGHGEWLSADIPDDRVCPEKVSEKQFARAFAEQARRNTLSLIVRTKPMVPMAQCSLAAGSMKGDDNADDYSGCSRGISYADVRAAHDQQIVDLDEAETFARQKADQLRKVHKIAV